MESLIKNVDEDIRILEKLKERFINLYDSQINQIKVEEIEKLCLAYLDYEEDLKIPSYRPKDMIENTVSNIDTLIKKSTNPYTPKNSLCGTNFKEIIDFLDKKIFVLKKGEC